MKNMRKMSVWNKGIPRLLIVLAVCLVSSTLVPASENEDRPEAAYHFTPEEIMYMTGIRETCGQEGGAYSLCDLDGDGISELFVSREGEGSLFIYKYNPATDSAVSDKTLTGDEKDTFLEELDENGHQLLWVDDRQWPDSSIIGVAPIVGDPGVRNDYYLSAGYDWLSKEHIKFEGLTATPINDLENLVEQKKEKMLTDREAYQGEDIQRLRDYYDLAVDWDSRNKNGVEPVKKYLEAVQEVSTLSELTELLTNPERCPFCIFMKLSVTLDEKDTSSWALQIDEDQFSVLPRYFHTLGEEDIQAERGDFSQLAGHVLERVGFSKEDITTALTQCYEIEDILLTYARASEDKKIDELDGFVSEDTYRLDMKEEEKLARLGEIIGHELTNGFDPSGIKYDKDGNMVETEDNPYGWMTEEDYEAFQKKAGKLSEYFDRIIPFPYSACSGDTVCGEAAADIGGMSICLKIAEDIEDFDYDLFFRTHALFWMKQDSLINEREAIYDVHPLSHLRINTTVQQFDEFSDTYGVKEGDGMYLDPDDRVVIW